MSIVLANRDYGPAGKGWGAHMSDEGMQLQEGLHHAGWTLSGLGFDNMLDVREILKRYQPECVLVSDKRDFDPQRGAFRKDLMFRNLGELAKHPEVFKVAVVKDAHSYHGPYYRSFVEEIQADAVLIYYHERSVLAQYPWLAKYPLIRTYHSIDADMIRKIPFTERRKRAVVSGAQNASVYPLRNLIELNRARIGAELLSHPGYSNQGSTTPSYCVAISRYRVHFATASKYGFALRKIIESVAVGTAPITDLPEYDALPEIDAALTRIALPFEVEKLRTLTSIVEASWRAEERKMFAEKALAFYDYRAAGLRLDAAIQQARLNAGNAVPAH